MLMPPTQLPVHLSLNLAWAGMLIAIALGILVAVALLTD